MQAWAIILIVVAAAVVVALIIVLPLVLGGGGEPDTTGGMAVSVAFAAPNVPFDSTTGAPTLRPMSVTVTQNGVAVVNTPVITTRELLGTTGALGLLVGDDIADADVVLGEAAGCTMTDGDPISYQWEWGIVPANRALRDNTGPRAWSERITWTAYEGGTCAEPTGGSASATIELTPEPAVAPTTMYVESAVMNVNENRINITVRTLGTPLQLVAVTAGCQIGFGWGGTTSDVTTTDITLANDAPNVIHATFLPGVLSGVPFTYPSGIFVGGSLVMPLAYIPAAGAITNVTTGAVLPIQCFMATMA